jgi:hypothetical protein
MTESQQRSARLWVIVGIAAAVVVLLSGLVLAVADTGLPLPAAVVLGALAIALVTVVGAGVFGYRDSRAEGRGVWRSVRAGTRTSFGIFFDLF